MIILHNSIDKGSRDFVGTVLGHTVDADEFVGGVLAEGGYTIYDWYMGGREAWWAINGTKGVSAFPSVVVDVPEYDEEIIDIDGEVVSVLTHPAQQVALRAVISISEVDDFLTATNSILTKSKNLGLTPSPETLTRANLNDAATGRTT